MLESGPLPDLQKLVINDFEPYVCRNVPVVGECLATMRTFFPYATTVTGSGAAVFSVVLPGEEHCIRRCEEAVKRLGAVPYSVDWE
jgi:4-diphosphocytidyl-2C-methyl-D-erythritol kinase